MEILLTEARSGDADAVAERLTAAGHLVSRCNLAGSDRCAPLVNQTGCPLRERPISMVVDVRGAEVEFGAHELGAMCAVQAAVPLVVCGPTPGQAGPWRDADVRCTEEALLDVLELANPVAGAATRHRVEQAVLAALRTLGRDGPVDVAIESTPGVIRVIVTIDGPPPHTLAALLSKAVQGALAGLTPHWAGATVTLSARDQDEAQAQPPADELP